jgi:hypothetical protein
MRFLEDSYLININVIKYGKFQLLFWILMPLYSKHGNAIYNPSIILLSIIFGLTLNVIGKLI